jgi:carbonic anhydrase
MKECHKPRGSMRDKEINHFITGYKKFRSHYFCNDKKNPLYKKLVREGQSPTTMVIACSDSRVDPSLILGAQPGELFVVRNVANLVPPCDNNPKHHGTSAALEFAVQTLKVSHIIVLGHSHCGGIRALLTAEQQSHQAHEHSFITSWTNIVSEAKEKVLATCKDQSLDAQEKVCEEHSLLISLRNLRTFPWIEEKVHSGTLTLHAWRFDLSTGIIQHFDEDQNKFEDLEI